MEAFGDGLGGRWLRRSHGGPLDDWISGAAAGESVDEAMEVSKRIGARQTLFTHIAHALAHEQLVDLGEAQPVGQPALDRRAPGFAADRRKIQRMKILVAYKRVVDATFTLKMVERYGMFPQKWQAGRVGVDTDSVAFLS